MVNDCGHLLCELIDDRSCSLATGRSRGCRPNLTSKTIAPEVIDEVRALLGTIDLRDRDAAIRLAAKRARTGTWSPMPASRNPSSRLHSSACAFAAGREPCETGGA
jgi:hypothetical protein